MPSRAAIVVALAMVACGGGAGNLSPAESAYAQLIYETCATATSCASSAPASWHYGTDQGTCESNMTAALGDVGASVIAGRVAFSATNGASCIEYTTSKFEGESCDQFWSVGGSDVDSTCAAAFVGEIVTGAMCFSAFDCVSGDACTLDSSTGVASYPGVCQVSHDT